MQACPIVPDDIETIAPKSGFKSVSRALPGPLHQRLSALHSYVGFFGLYDIIYYRILIHIPILQFLQTLYPFKHFTTRHPFRRRHSFRCPHGTQYVKSSRWIICPRLSDFCPPGNVANVLVLCCKGCMPARLYITERLSDY